MLFSGSALISMSVAGTSTFSFIKSTSVVPPATNAALPRRARSSASRSLVTFSYENGCMTGLSHAAARGLNRPDDVRIRTAAAQVSAHLLPHVIVGRSARFVEQRCRRHDLTGGAVSALEGIVLDERVLHRVEHAVAFQTFDGDDIVAFVHHRKRETRQHAAPVDEDRTCAALTVIAALLGSKELQLLAQHVEQRRTDIEIERDAFAVHAQAGRASDDAGGQSGFGDRRPARRCRRRLPECTSIL